MASNEDHAAHEPSNSVDAEVVEMPSNETQDIEDAPEAGEAQEASSAGPGRPAEARATLKLEPLEAAQKQAEEYLLLAKRARAELENYRRRTTRERQELLRYGSEPVLRDLLEVLDNVDRALEHAQEDSPLAEGFRMLHGRLVGLMERHNVAEVPGVGEVFDPNIHEALQTVHDEDVEKNHIVDVYQKGYTLYDRLLRPARVSVSGGE